MSMPAVDHHEEGQQFRTTWRGIAIEVRHVAEWVKSPCLDHIEIRSGDKTPLPITETGYKSHFIPPETIAEYGSALDYVTAWLDHEATTRDWQKRELEARQLSLF